MAYFGRADRARQYFIDLGFEPAHRQTTADFLVAGSLLLYAGVCSAHRFACFLVTDPTARIVRDEFKGRTPQTAAEFASTFLASRAAIENRADMDSYRKDFVGKPERVLGYQQSVTAEHATTARKGSSYMISLPMQARAVMLRRLQILRGNFATQLIIVM
jgi:ATP-binding cassette subfamily G (WHITE) protein 2 (SNQ2)